MFHLFGWSNWSRILSVHSFQVLRRDIPWETYMTTKLITGTGLQLLRRYDKKAENYKAQLLDDVIFISISILFPAQQESFFLYSTWKLHFHPMHKKMMRLTISK